MAPAMVKGGRSTTRWSILRIFVSLSKTIEDLRMGTTITEPRAIDVKDRGLESVKLRVAYRERKKSPDRNRGSLLRYLTATKYETSG